MRKARENPNNKRSRNAQGPVKQDLTLAAMAETLNAEGFVTSRGAKFTPWTVSVLIKRYNLNNNHHETVQE